MKRALATGNLLALLACDGGAASAPPPVTSRVEAVSATAPKTDPLAGFCDVHAGAGQGKAFALPAVTGNAPAGAGQSRALWLNLWATWCKPCIEEMPMIGRWQQRLGSEGKAFDVAFLAVDEDPAVVPAFRTQHPGIPETLLLADPKSLPTVIAGLGLDTGAGLPVHVFVEPGSKVRCVRAGAITEAHYSIVAELL